MMATRRKAAKPAPPGASEPLLVRSGQNRAVTPLTAETPSATIGNGSVMIAIQTRRPGQFLRASAMLLSVVLGIALAGTRMQAIAKCQRAQTLPTQASLTLPAGTILSVRLNSALSSIKSKPGDRITGRVMQDVPLPNGRRIKAGAKLVGEIVDAQPAAARRSAQVSLRFDSLETGHQRIPLRTSLRALASWSELDHAQLPAAPRDYGTSDNWTTTIQVGGDVVYGFAGPVVNEAGETVGTVVNNGVLARARAKTGTNCRGPVAGNDRPQALWLFSADACGVYGYPNVRIEHAGRAEPVGQVRLAAVKGDLKVRGASGMLLRVM